MSIEIAELRSHWNLDVVVRRVDRPLDELLVAQLHSIGALNFTGPFVEAHDGFLASRRAPAAVQLRKFVPPASVEVHVVEWSNDGAELRIVPTSPYFGLWSEHRRDRYFDLVHDVADRIASVLECTHAAA